MQSHRPLLSWLLGLTVLATPVMLLAQATSAPSIDIPADQLTTSLTEASQKVIADAMTAAAAQLNAPEGAGRPDKVKAAREAIQAIYAKYDSSAYHDAVAQAAAKTVAPLLAAEIGGKPDLLVQVNAALVLSQMAVAANQQSLQTMVSHTNPAVRYLGWRGYLAARDSILAKGDSASTKLMMDASAKAASDETSGIVLRVVYDMLNFPRVGPSNVQAAAYDDVRKQAMAAIQANWAQRCQQVINGNAQMAEACRHGVSALASGWPLVAPAQQTAFTQQIVDVAWCAATAYDQAYSVAERSTGLTKDEAQVQLLNYTALLRMAEQVLNSIAGANNAFIEKTLTDTNITERAAAPLGYTDLKTGEQLGVLGWIKQLSSRGVQTPKFTPAEGTPATGATTTTAPATPPAG